MSGTTIKLGSLVSAPIKKPEPPPPAPFKIDSSTKLEDWKKWQISFRYYAHAVNLEQKSHDVQLSTFKSVVGPDALEIYNTFSILDITDVESVMRKFDDHFKPKVNVTLERYKLYKLNQKIGQKFDEFLADVTSQVDKCEFKDMRDEIVLYKIVGGIDNDEIRNALLADADLKYDKAVQICRASSTMHFMSGKENSRKGSSKKEVELDNALEVLLTEGSRTRKKRKVAAEKFKKSDPENNIPTMPKVIIKRETRSDRKLSVSENHHKETVVEKERSAESEKDRTEGPSKEEFLKENVNLQPSLSAENDLRGANQERDWSDGGDSDWRGDDDQPDDDDDDDDYDPSLDISRTEKTEHKAQDKRENRKVRKKKVNKKRFNRKSSTSGEKSVKNKQFPCDICNKILGTELALERHRSIHVHGEDAICHYCGKKFRKYFLRRHMTASHHDILGCAPPKYFACDVCNFKTRFPENLRRHKFQHTGEKPLACEHCDYKCITPRLMKAHISKLHTGERPFPCTVCKRGFLHSDALKRHMITHMTKEEKEKYLERMNTTCETCGKVFSTRAALKTHSMRHAGEKPFACHICEFRTVTNGALNSHIMLRHSDEKPFVCTACGYSCKQKTTLQQHMLTHTAEKPHTCEVCGKKFAQLSHVKRHRMTHTGEKPHVCEICGHRWTTRGNLKAHMKVHQKQTGDPSQYTPPRKRQKKVETSVVTSVAVQSNESGPPEHAAADAIIQWSEQVSAINTTHMDYTPNLETPPPFHPTYPVHQGNPRPPDCRFYQPRQQWPINNLNNPNNQGYRQDQNQNQ